MKSNDPRTYRIDGAQIWVRLWISWENDVGLISCAKQYKDQSVIPNQP